jgi:hypothetical protein
LGPDLKKFINKTTLSSTKSSFFDTGIYKIAETSTEGYITSYSNKFTTDYGKKPKENACGHVVTTYMVPSVLHLIAYIIGFIYFRINENEQLYALMEKVFLAVNQTLKVVSQDKVIRRLKYTI